MHKKTILLILPMLFLLCCRNSKIKNPSEEFKGAIGNIFSFPDTIEIIDNGSLYFASGNEFIQQYKDSPIIISIIWGDCHVCTKKLLQWNGIIAENIFGKDTKYIFVISTSDKEYFLRTFYEPLDYIPELIIDSNEDFFKINDLENNPGYNTFLLDQNHRIVLVGNPLIFDNLTETYLKKLKKLE